MNKPFAIPIFRILAVGVLLFSTLFPESSACREIDMRPYWDETIPLENPHKGWYHHFPDNHVNKYKIANDTDLTKFPGMDHLYIRLAWAYLEPLESQHNWQIIDQLIEKWVGLGLGIAFRISCRETSTDRIEQQFATPRWVMEAGAKGDFYRLGEKAGPEGPWEPVFDDSVYLEKLGNFLKVFAARYDGQPWLRYVDIGSIGDWGEGHCWAGSRTPYNFDQRKVHVDLYLKSFTRSQLTITDDFVYEIQDSTGRIKMHHYIIEKGIAYRDDSPLVNYYVGEFPETYSVRSPEYFAAVYRHRPVVFELEHYGTVKRQGNWTGEPESLMAQKATGQSGADFFRGALELLHATYIGYHGYAHEWLTDNPDLTVELLNRCGYWYFIHGVQLEDAWKAGELNTLQITWENRGVAPAYHPYDLVLKLSGPDVFTVNLESGNQTFQPEQALIKQYSLVLPKSMIPGEYTLSLKLFSPQAQETVFLPLDPVLKLEQDFYRICTIKVKR